jgi:catechol 2,3-dioxygenase-like lactoylglutathione lyase family enzyme
MVRPLRRPRRRVTLRVAMASDIRLDGFAAVFTVRDVAASLGFFTQRLAFAEHFRLGDPPEYAIVERDAVQIHLMSGREAASLGRSTIYVFLRDVDALHEHLTGRGCAVEVPPTDFPYGMREMSVRDPDGNRITFGQEVKGGS